MKRVPSPLRVAAAALTLWGAAQAGQISAQKPTATPALPSGVAPFEVAQITTGAWYGRFGFGNCAWLDLGDGVLVVDTGGSLEDAANLKKQIKETTNGKPVKWIVLTHLHGHANNGLKAFLPTDATIFVNARVAADVALAFQARDAKAKSPIIMGVSDRSVVVVAGRRLELGTPPSTGAATIADLYLYDLLSGVAFVGDLVTPGHCPLMSDDMVDPKGWLAALEGIRAFHPALIVGTDGDGSKLIENEITGTRTYITRVLDLIAEFKKKGYPEARVASELQLRKQGDYCPLTRDGANVVPLFRRAGADGVVGTANVAPPPTPPAKKKG